MILNTSLRHILFYCSLSFICSSCIAVKVHQYADLNKNIAQKTIIRLKSDTLVILVPTYNQKEYLLKNSRPKNKSEKASIEKRLLQLYAEREIAQLAIVQSFRNYYSFSETLFIPDSLISDFEAGIQKDYFLNEQLEIDPAITYSNLSPIKLVQQFDQEWHIKIKNKLIPNPFPNYYLYGNGLYGFMGYASHKEMYKRVAEVFQKRFEQYYNDPDQVVYL